MKQLTGLFIVLNYCPREVPAVLRLFNWCRTLDSFASYSLMLAVDSAVPMDIRKQVLSKAHLYFRDVTEFVYPAWEEPGPTWPAACNNAFTNVMWYVGETIKKPFLWLESDCVPTKRNWCEIIDQEYFDCKQPFMGSVIVGAESPDSRHMNGVAIYPPKPYIHAPMFWNPPSNRAWDVHCGSEIAALCHPATSIQHVWKVDNYGSPCLHGDFPEPTFPDWDTVVDLVKTDTALFHRNKDGTLIKQLVTRLDEYGSIFIGPNKRRRKLAEIPVWHPARRRRKSAVPDAAGGTPESPGTTTGTERNGSHLPPRVDCGLSTGCGSDEDVPGGDPC